jgi:hypothetical protein
MVEQKPSYFLQDVPYIVSLRTEAALSYPSPCRIPLLGDEITGAPAPYTEAYRNFIRVAMKLIWS